MINSPCSSFFFNDTATTEIYTLSLHDALPICFVEQPREVGLIAGDLLQGLLVGQQAFPGHVPKVLLHLLGFQLRPFRFESRDRKSTRLNSSHANISYAVFCLKKKKKINLTHVY